MLKYIIYHQLFAKFINISKIKPYICKNFLIEKFHNTVHYLNIYISPLYQPTH